MVQANHRRIVFLGTAWLLLILAGCSGLGTTLSDYGKIRPNSDVTSAFEGYVIKPDLNYYISGSESEPNAIIGIDKHYTLVSDLWKLRVLKPPISPQGLPEKGTLRYYVDGMNAKTAQLTMILHGFDIMDNQGNDIGDWYSILIAPTSVKMLGDKKISISPPPQDIYERYEREGTDRTPLINE